MLKNSLGYILFLGVISLLFSSCTLFDGEEVSTNEPMITLNNINEIEEGMPLDEFGFYPVDAEVKEHRVKKNQSLYLILQRLDVNPERILEIEKGLEDIFDPSKIRPGQKYITYADGNGIDGAFRMVYYPNNLNYVAIDWSEDVEVKSGRKEVEIQIRETAGIIHSSLYQTLKNENQSPLLAYELSEIFAWEVNFFRIYKGDSYKVIYEQLMVDDKPYGIGNIIAAEFTHRGKTSKVYYFKNGERQGYFDDEGNSVQKALLKAPFKYNQRISSHYSHSRFHPVLKKRMPHYGVDYAAPLGTPVLSVGDGEVIESRYRGPNGNIVKIKHNGMYTTAYLHLNGFAKGIKKGAKVKQGQVIGYVGRTGRVTGVHLDYRLYVNNKPVNPVRFELPPSKAIEDSNRADFEKQTAILRAELDDISLPNPES